MIVLLHGQRVVRLAQQSVRFDFGMTLDDEVHGPAAAAGDRRLFVTREQRIRGRRRSGGGRRRRSGGGGGGRRRRRSGSDRGPVVDFVLEERFYRGRQGKRGSRGGGGHHRRRWRRRRRSDRRRLFALGRGISRVQERHVHRLDRSGHHGGGPLVRRRREHGQRRLRHRVMVTTTRDLRRKRRRRRSFVLRVLHVRGRLFFRKVRQEESAVVVDGLQRLHRRARGRRRVLRLADRRRRRLPVMHFVQNGRQIVKGRIVLQRIASAQRRPLVEIHSRRNHASALFHSVGYCNIEKLFCSTRLRTAPFEI